MRDLDRWPEAKLRGALARGVDLNLRRELETELAWRQFRRNSINREFVPAFLLVDPAERRT